MKKDVHSIAIVMLVLAVTLAACAQGSQSHTSNKKTKDRQWSALMGSTEQMHRAMASVEPSGDSDVDFVRLMLPHHQAAIDMAKAQLANGTDPQMRRLAQEIITDQQSEIELMQLWLQQHKSGSTRKSETTKNFASRD